MSDILNVSATSGTVTAPTPPRGKASSRCQYHFTHDGSAPLCLSVQSLEDAVKNPLWGDTPYDYVKWFDRIWRTGDPSQWGPDVFTPDAIMVDSAGSSVGAAQAASDFLLLFKYFPDLRGEVVSWAANDTELKINWHFIVTKKRMVPVVDKFMFIGGRVSHRQAYFDTMTFLAYLAENFGPAPLTDYFVDRFVRSTTGGGILFLPGLIWDLFRGLFRWSPVRLAPPNPVVAKAGDGKVTLTWPPVEGATSYTIKRSRVLAGPYAWIAMNVKAPPYTDIAAKNDTEWFYVVSTNSSANVPPIEPPDDDEDEATQ